jgi:hypothetical protein
MFSSNKKFLTKEQLDSFDKNGYLVVDFQLENSDLDRLIENVEPHYPPPSIKISRDHHFVYKMHGPM